ncbi:MAG: bifunctional riboflavin kinase/FAD synthetase [Alphaproteobacteria bacterium]|nr:bifunctional riboflavin kinase/FAD synthetase [Alphaproteobacteria bacterium]
MNQAVDPYTDKAPSEAASQDGVLALGNFDGVHRGHQAVVAAALDYARRHGMPVRVLTLEPHPRTFFSSPQTPFRLTPPSVKNRLLQGLGVDEVITLNFSPDIASLSAKAFVDQILAGYYKARHIVAGVDFVFGHKRAGTMEAMRGWLAPYGVGVTAVPLLKDEKGEAVSSSRLREALYQGDLAAARALLGRPWSITGIVVPGARRGRILGFPTANMELGEYVRPPFGVYAIMARRVGSREALPGVANIGTRPTIDGVHELLEFHLFQAQGDLYDQEWEVELHYFLRPEEKFASLEALQDQIMQDIVRAKELLAAVPAPI